MTRVYKSKRQISVMTNASEKVKKIRKDHVIIMLIDEN